MHYNIFCIMKKKSLVFLFVPTLLLQPTAVLSESDIPEQPRSLEDRVQEILDYYYMSEDNVSISYYNTVSRETYHFHDERYMFAASTYKLPLNMYYYMKQNAGELNDDSMINGYRLADAHYLSIVNSDNDASEALMNGLGTYKQYKDLMMTTFGDDYYRDLNNVDPALYRDNDYPAGYLMNVLQYLYEHQSDFQQLLEYMSSPDQINGVARTIPEDIKIYQKQGWYTNVNTVAEIVMAEQPYLAVIMIDDPSGNSINALANLNSTIYSYTKETTAYMNALQPQNHRNTDVFESKTDGMTRLHTQKDPFKITVFYGTLVLLCIDIYLTIRSIRSQKRGSI